MTAPTLCDVCHEPILDTDYRCCGYDRNTWRTLIVHRGCWHRRNELAAPGRAIVREEPKAMQEESNV